jgi:hypothetical protein
MKKVVKFVLPVAFLASTGIAVIGCEEKKPTPPAKQTPPAETKKDGEKK